MVLTQKLTAGVGRAHRASVIDYQMIDVLNDHLCYVVTDRKTPWHLPYRQNFSLLSKIVITHVAKSRCRLTIYNQVDWLKPPGFGKGLSFPSLMIQRTFWNMLTFVGIIQSRALSDLELDSLDLADVISDQVRKLGAQSRTKKSIQIFGHVGQQSQALEFAGSESLVMSKIRRSLKRRTMTGLCLESFGSLLESIATTLMQWFAAIVQWSWKTFNAHTILLGILAISVLTNVIFSSKDTSAWWRERKAAKFMTRVGVGPNLIMSKAVFVQDLEDAVIGDNLAFEGAGNQWYVLFLPI